MSGIDCTACGRKTQSYVCGTCCDEVGDLLTGLADGHELTNGDGRLSRPFLQNLQDAALGHTRHGESARRSTEKGSPMMHHEKSSNELLKIHNIFGSAVQGLCASYGVEAPFRGGVKALEEIRRRKPHTVNKEGADEE